MIQAMRFWEAISVFRDEPEILVTVFESDRWRSQYYELYSHIGELVREQRRDVMDMLLPLKLTREIAANYHKKDFGMIQSNWSCALLGKGYRYQAGTTK